MIKTLQAVGLGLAMLAGVASVTTAGDLVLVNDGKPMATIVVSAKPNAVSWFAAGELQTHIKLITGAELPIATDTQQVDGARILVGPSAALKATGLTNENLGEQEYLIKFLTNDTLVLVGTDGGFAAPKELPSHDIPGGMFDAQGTMYATYDFLEKYCDVRWYAPGPLGTEYTPSKTLSVKTDDLRRKPKMDCRRGHGWPYQGLVGKVENDGREMDLFYRRNKFGGRGDSTCHAFYGYYDRFWEKNTNNAAVWEGEHHEFFPPNRGVQLCYSSEATVSQVVHDAHEAFHGHAKPGAIMGPNSFAVVPMDNSSWCVCSNCDAQLDPKLKTSGFANGNASRYIWGFTAKVAREIAKTDPGKYIAQLAYSDYTAYPEGVDLPTNILVGVCLGTRGWLQKEKEPEYALYKSWVKKVPGRLTPCWLYQCFPNEYAGTAGFQCWPGFHASLVAWEFRMFGEDGMAGIDLCGTADYIDGWLTIKMADDPFLDATAAMHEFFTRFYGPAGEPMEKAYWLIENGYTNPSNYPAGQIGTCSEAIGWGSIGTADRMAKIQTQVDDAKAKATTDIQKKRVAAFEDNIWAVMKKAKAEWDVKAPYATDVEKIKALPPPSATIARISGVPGGDPAKIDWKNVTSHKIDRSNNGYPAAGRYADLQMAHDGTNFYIHLYEHGDTSKFVNDGWFYGNRWELFYGPDRNGDQNTNATYNQIGLHVGSKLDTWRGDYEGVKYQSSNDAKGWDMNLVIPLAKLTDKGMKPGDTFYMNFIRGANDGTSTLAFSPIFQMMYHCPTRFAAFTLEK